MLVEFGGGVVKTLKASLPLLNAMVAFEAAARCASLTLAADELAIAQSAVSRHIANLETHLSIGLFERKGNRVILTPRPEASWPTRSARAWVLSAMR